MDTLKSRELIETSKETANFYNNRNEEELLFVIKGNGGVIVNTENYLIKNQEI